jgi:hypothetical protein
MSSFSEYGEPGAPVLVLVVLVVEDDEDEAARASCMHGIIAKERIRTKTSKDRDFMKTDEADSLRY